jgi:hypothetical protein
MDAPFQDEQTLAQGFNAYLALDLLIFLFYYGY